ncbi:hypothetical protein Pse7367_3930 (plasmid) [Thalassoporum mexicanum PCC 7367]|uniref:hypothetical protein n=1 Tax=Thalassoporum mexicanum TaxID=3457544 RepID=UPI0002A000E3|nr:hypothetical protein [Pseudanabaena sp. PCC 7367]AFY72146.1 hypothetical protein Pse7367_3930 [Pseudanabaena sp. PCC 7367]
MEELNLQLKAELSQYDGRSKPFLMAIVNQFATEPGYLDRLISLLEQAEHNLNDAATWLIKHHLENGNNISETQIKRLLQQLEHLTSWSAQLHLCQSLRHLPISLAQTESLHQWLTPLLSHKRPFLRTWSLDALCYLAEINPDLEPQANQALAKAIDDPAASVRARARNLHQ